MAQIQIKWMNSKAKTINLKVELTDSIVEVKNRIESQERIPADQQKLFKKEGGFCWSYNQKLWDEDKLEDLEIKEGSTIYMDTEDQSTFRIGMGEKVFGMKWVHVGKTKPKSLTEITCSDPEKFFYKEMERNEREKDKAEGEKEDAETGKGKDFYKLSDDESNYYWELFQCRKEKVDKMVQIFNQTIKTTHPKNGFIDLSYNESVVHILGGKWTLSMDGTDTPGLKWIKVGTSEGPVPQGQELKNYALAKKLISGLKWLPDTEPGLKWLPAGNTEPRHLKHVRGPGMNLLAEELTKKTEFTKKEWESFGIKDLRPDHFIKSGNSYFQPAGTECTVTFTIPQWDKLDIFKNKGRDDHIDGIKELHVTHFVKEGCNYFKPVIENEWLSQNDCIKAADDRYDHIFT